MNVAPCKSLFGKVVTAKMASKRAFASTLIALLLASFAQAQQPERRMTPPWRITLEEFDTLFQKHTENQTLHELQRCVGAQVTWTGKIYSPCTTRTFYWILPVGVRAPNGRSAEVFAWMGSGKAERVVRGENITVTGTIWKINVFGAMLRDVQRQKQRPCQAFQESPDAPRRMTPDGQYVAPFQPQAPWPDNRIVKIRDSNGPGTWGLGSGAVIAIDKDPSYILTCAHVTSGMDDWVLIIFSDGKSSDIAKVIAYDRQADCAILKLAEGPRDDSFKIAATEPATTERLYAAGFPEAGKIRIRHTLGSSINPGVFTFMGGSIDGESGGPVCNESGEVVAVIHKTDGHRTYCANLQTIQAMQTQCRNGNCGPPPGYWTEQPPIVIPHPQVPPPIVNPPLTNDPPTPGPGDDDLNDPPPVPDPGKPCNCGPRWTEINQTIADLRITISDQAKLIATLQADVKAQSEVNVEQTVDNRITQYFEQHPVDVPDVPDVPTADDIIDKLPHETPIRVYFPDGRMAGEAKTNIFTKDGSIDLTFDPRALLDEAKRQAR